MALAAKSLSVSVGRKVLLQPTDLLFRSGDLTVILGPNGAGKSSLVKALLGLVKRTGHVELDDRPLTDLDPKQRARRVAYLPQGQSHAWPLSVESVVALGRYPHDAASSGDADDAVGRVLDRMRLHDLRAQSVLTLSGGEQMRVAVARALAVEADFLLADEPLASLDPRYQFEIMDALAGEVQNGRGVVIVMHDLALAAQYADRIVFLNHGAVVADGAAVDVLTEETVGQAYGVRCKIATIRRMDGMISVALPDRIA